MTGTIDRSEAFEEARDDAAAPTGPGWQRACRRLTDDRRFGSLVIGVILLNALSLGLVTFHSVDRSIGDQLRVLDTACLGFFVAELTLRLAAVGFRPDRFLRRGWNVFDLLAVGASFVPGLGANATALRVARMLRVARLLSVLPDVSVLLTGLRRAARPAFGLLLLTMLMMYLYAIVGWSLFAKADPEHWGDVGLAMLTLFQLLTHKDWPPILAAVREASPFAVPYVVSFLVITVLIIVQFMIAIVLSALERATEEIRERGIAHRLGQEGPNQRLLETIAGMHAALDRLERRRALASRAR